MARPAAHSLLDGCKIAEAIDYSFNAQAAVTRQIDDDAAMDNTHAARP